MTGVKKMGNSTDISTMKKPNVSERNKNTILR